MEKERPRRLGVRGLLWIKITLPLVAAAVLVCAALVCHKKVSSVKVERLSAMVYSQVERVAELTVIKYNYGNVAVPKKSAVNGMARAYSIVKFQGVIRMGLRDISQVSINVLGGGRAVEVVLPHSEVLDNTLFSQEVFDEKRSIFVPIATQEIFDEIKSEMMRTEELVVEEGFLQEADERMVQLIRAMLQGAGIKDADVRFMR